MPIEATPLRQLVVALATNVVGEVTAVLFAGEATVTPANAGAAKPRSAGTTRGEIRIGLTLRDLLRRRAQISRGQMCGPAASCYCKPRHSSPGISVDVLVRSW